jgi:transcriptional regulator with XRE-family HTH domain
MEQTKPSRLSSDDAARARTAQEFADWLTARMRERSYDLSPKGGGQARLVRETGLGRTTISRILNGHPHIPDPDSLRKIAEVLALPFGEVLIRAGVLTENDLRAYQTAPPSDRPPLTTDEAADALGLTDPVARQMHAAGVQAARDLQRQRLDGESPG